MKRPIPYPDKPPIRWLVKVLVIDGREHPSTNPILQFKDSAGRWQDVPTVYQKEKL